MTTFIITYFFFFNVSIVLSALMIYPILKIRIETLSRLKLQANILIYVCTSMSGGLMAAQYVLLTNIVFEF